MSSRSSVCPFCATEPYKNVEQKADERELIPTERALTKAVSNWTEPEFVTA
jgi:hypothetical protein